jgi:hypothetical protein
MHGFYRKGKFSGVFFLWKKKDLAGWLVARHQARAGLNDSP